MDKGMEKLTVLILDDAAIIRTLTIDLLRENSITEAIIGTILEAADIASAMQLLAQHYPRIIILDIKVPGSSSLRNGIDLLKEVKASYPATEVIMLTNHATSQYRVECMRLGAAFFLDKSVEFDQLPMAVEALALHIRYDKPI
jgi:DNA-binding NarL/FixJ family response regulator